MLQRQVALLAFAAACAPAPPRAPMPAPVTPPRPVTPAGPSATAPAIHWYEDDPAGAFARATRERKLVVVDLWAAWCHTCLSMQKFVLTREKLPVVAERFVFLAIDTELAKNAEFLSQFPPSGWPTFYVLSPLAPNVRGRWVGAASPSQFARFLADAEHADELARSGSGSSEEPWASLTRGDELASEARYADAAQLYAQALARAPADWHRAPDVRVALASALLRSGNANACVDQAFESSFAALTPAISAADHASYTLECAARLLETDARRRPARERVERRLAALCERGAPELTPDDRGDACGNLVTVREALGDAAGARHAALTRLEVLDAAARGMPPEVAVIYDPALTDTLLWLGRGEEALQILQAHELALPSSYTPPYSIARVAAKLGRFELGLSAIDRALALAHGPRRANVYGVKVELLLGAGRKRDAITALQAQLGVLQALPERQKRPDAERLARERLERLRASTP